MAIAVHGRHDDAGGFRVKHLVAGLLLAAGLGTGQAQSLDDLYKAAHDYDATYLSARSLAESARYRAAQVDALQRPKLSLSGNTNIGRADTALGTGSFNNRAVQVAGRQPLFNRTNTASIDQAQRELESASLRLEAAEQDLIVRISQAYFDVLAAKDALATTRTSKVAINEQLASAQRNFEVGTATITDTREAQARYDLATAQEIAAENDLRNKRIALDQLVGRSNVEPLGLQPPVTLPAVLPADADAWASQADAQHPSIRLAQLSLEVAQLETQKAQAGHLPTVDVVGSLSDSYNSGGSSGSSQLSRSGTTKSASIGLELNLPLFAGLSVQNRIKETLVLEDKSRNDLEAARRAVSQGTRQAYFGVQSLQAQVLALEAAESSSALALEATQLGYRVGVRVNIDVLNAQTQLFTTRRDLSKARYDTLLGGLRLRQAAGQLKPEDVTAVSRLLGQ
ncbi:MAG: TolC family outer membrane protein [Rhizobacter sp.]